MRILRSWPAGRSGSPATWPGRQRCWPECADRGRRGGGGAAGSGDARGPRIPSPGAYSSRASGFASGKPLDTAPGCLTLGQFAEETAGAR
jgi:hypothetical protein